jgi:hypothetical protein
MLFHNSSSFFSIFSSSFFALLLLTYSIYISILYIHKELGEYVDKRQHFLYCYYLKGKKNRIRCLFFSSYFYYFFPPVFDDLFLVYSIFLCNAR